MLESFRKKSAWPFAIQHAVLSPIRGGRVTQIKTNTNSMYVSAQILP